jgi:hypothetical protein
VSNSSGDKAPWLGFLGLLLLAAALPWILNRRVDGAVLARAYQCGFASPAVTLGQSQGSGTNGGEQAVLSRRLERARIVSSYDPEHLRAVPPFTLINDGRFWPYAADAHPQANLRLRWDGSESGELYVQPYDGVAWSVPLRSKNLVQPDWSPYSNLVAYYDLGRVWIVDVQGRRFQSLVQEPLLDEGGRLRFSADGTALAFYFEADQRWKAQDLYVLSEP